MKQISFQNMKNQKSIIHSLKKKKINETTIMKKLKEEKKIKNKKTKHKDGKSNKIRY